MEAPDRTENDRVNAAVILFDVAPCPVERIGERPDLLALEIGGMVHDMRDTEDIAQFMRPDLKLLNGLRGLQSFQ